MASQPNNRQLTSWALPRIRSLLPLDDDSLTEVIMYSLTLPKAEAAEHLKNLLGDSGAALEFIAEVNRRRGDDINAASVSGAQPAAQSQQTTVNDDIGNDGVPRYNRQAKRGKAKAPLHNAGPVRRPEGYGDVSGGYQKEMQMPLITDPEPIGSGSGISREASAAGHSRSNSAGTTSKPQNNNGNPAPSSASKLPPSASGNIISDFLPNVRSKAQKPRHHIAPPTASSQSTSGISTLKHLQPTSKTVSSSINDITSALTALELTTNPSLPSSQQRTCSCAATLHPLFTPAPNCLSCGKIICAYEGLQPCSFCGTPILSSEEVQSMIRELKRERGEEKMAEHNLSVSIAKGAKGGTSPRSFSGVVTPESGASGDEAAVRARAHRDKLLGFQANNAQRTRIHDEAADYELGSRGVGGGKGLQWMSPVQRAAALKKQQAYAREVEEMGRPEWEREKTVVSLNIKGGKLMKTYRKESVRQQEAEAGMVDDAEVVEQNDAVGGAVKSSFGDNPLLKGGGLIRPIWKPQGDSGGSTGTGQRDAKGKGKESERERKSVWRRVQDDNEDNEQWILDGGIKGYGVEDESQQECG
jgi:hypothetical protein